MRLADFSYELPEDRIARLPAERREDARLLVLDRATGERRHRRVSDLPEYLRRGDLVVVNDVSVARARVRLRRSTGGRLEGLIVEVAENEARVLLDGKGRLRPGEILRFEEDPDVAIELLARAGEGWRVAVRGAAPRAALDRLGRVPLPPYIRKARRAEGLDEEALEALDRKRYQTVFAKGGMAVAAPTAGLHLGEALLGRIESAGSGISAVRLEVGPGTFAPIRTQEIEDHEIAEERYDIPVATADAIARARREGGRVLAVGTTVVRTLEGAADEEGRVRPGAGSTRLFVRPGYRFRVVDALLTNFHLPESTLLVLVAAFAGRERILDLYREAVRERYRFYSYGDAMLLL